MSTIIVSKITTASAMLQNSIPVSLEVVGIVQMNNDGYKNPKLVPRVYVVPPADGIYEFDFFLDEPDGPFTDKLTGYFAVYEWADFPVGEVKGVKIYGEDEPQSSRILE